MPTSIKKVIIPILCCIVTAITFPSVIEAKEFKEPVRVGIETVSNDDILFLIQEHTGVDRALAALIVQRMSNDEQNELLDGVTNMLLLARGAQLKGLQFNADVAARLRWTRLNVLADAYVESLSKNWDLSEKTSKLFYKNHSELYTQEKQCHIRHILVGNMAEAHSVLLRLLTGIPFEKLATQLSLDFSTARDGGDMGWIKESELPEVFNVVKRMKVTDFSEPIKAEYGFHIIQLLEEKGGALLPYEQVKEQVQKDLEAEYINEELLNLKKGVEISNESEALDEIRIP